MLFLKLVWEDALLLWVALFSALWIHEILKQFPHEESLVCYSSLVIAKSSGLKKLF